MRLQKLTETRARKLDKKKRSYKAKDKKNPEVLVVKPLLIFIRKSKKKQS